MKSAQNLGCLVALAGCVAASTANTAAACGALPTPTFGFAAQQPDASVQGLPRNASIVLHLTCAVSSTEAPIVQAAACRFTPLGSKVSLRPTAGGEDVLGRLVAGPEALIFVPAAPLAANTDYTLTASLGQLDSTAPGASFSTALHTSDAMLSPFVSEKPPAVVSEWYDAPVTQCDNVKLVGKAALDALAPSICPGPYTNCHAAPDTQRTLRMHATFGPLTGGSTALPYASQLKLSSGGLSSFEGDEGAAPASPENAAPPPTGIVFSAAYDTALAAGSTDLFVDLLPPADLKAQLCVRARAFDAAGQVLYAPDHCDTYVGWMTDAEWAAEAASEAAKQDAGGLQTAGLTGGLDASAPGSSSGAGSPVPGSSHDDGCSVRLAARSQGANALALLGVALSGLLYRRRRCSRS